MVTSASLPMMRRLQSVCSDLADLAEQNDMMVRSYSDNCVTSRSPPSAASTEEIPVSGIGDVCSILSRASSGMLQ